MNLVHAITSNGKHLFDQEGVLFFFSISVKVSAAIVRGPLMLHSIHALLQFLLVPAVSWHSAAFINVCHYDGNNFNYGIFVVVCSSEKHAFWWEHGRRRKKKNTEDRRELKY